MLLSWSSSISWDLPVADHELGVGHSDPVIVSADDPHHAGVRRPPCTDTAREKGSTRHHGITDGVLPEGARSSQLRRIPDAPRLGGMVLLRLTGALSAATARPAMNCGPATLCRFRRFAGETESRTDESEVEVQGNTGELQKCSR